MKGIWEKEEVAEEVAGYRNQLEFQENRDGINVQHYSDPGLPQFRCSASAISRLENGYGETRLEALKDLLSKMEKFHSVVDDLKAKIAEEESSAIGA